MPKGLPGYFNPEGRIYGNVGEIYFAQTGLFRKAACDTLNVGWAEIGGIAPTPTPTATPTPTPTPTATATPTPTPTPTATATPTPTPTATARPTPTPTTTPTPTPVVWNLYTVSAEETSPADWGPDDILINPAVWQAGVNYTDCAGSASGAGCGYTSPGDGTHCDGLMICVRPGTTPVVGLGSITLNSTCFGNPHWVQNWPTGSTPTWVLDNLTI